VSNCYTESSCWLLMRIYNVLMKSSKASEKNNIFIAKILDIYNEVYELTTK
jgi:hypothetical protein